MNENELLSPEPALTEEAVGQPTAPEEPASELDTLRKEIGLLRAELEQKSAEQERIRSEMGEFQQLFPNKTLGDVPPPVWQQVERGVPLSAAYALYEKKSTADALRADEINRRNAEHSAGRLGQNTAREFYTPDEVRAMSPSEVRENYKTIRESMKKWHA